MSGGARDGSAPRGAAAGAAPRGATAGHRSSTTREGREAARARILAAAAALVDEGLPLRMRDVARRAGVSLGYVYLCFRSKAELRAALARHRGRELEREALLLRLNPGRSPEAALRALLAAARALAAAEPPERLAERLRPEAQGLLVRVGHPAPDRYAPVLARALAGCAAALAGAAGRGDAGEAADATEWLARVLSAGLVVEAGRETPAPSAGRRFPTGIPG